MSTTLIAFLRAINVGGTGKLPMSELRDLCAQTGMQNVRTYIQSGNVVFTSSVTAPKAKAKLEQALVPRLGASARVFVRSAAELAEIVAANPFPDASPNQILILFLDKSPPQTAIKEWNIPGRERLSLHGREIFIHFPEGQGKSRLKVPFAEIGTGRNLNTVTALLAMARGEA